MHYIHRLSLLCLVVLVIASCGRPAADDQDKQVAEAVQATLVALLPTPETIVIEVTRVVTVSQTVASAPTPHIDVATPRPVGIEIPTLPEPESLLDILAFERETADLINAQRLANNVSPLTIEPRLTEIARRHSKDMAENNFAGHNGSDGSSYQQRVTAAGFDGAYSNEAVLWGQGINPRAAVEWWLKDEAHRQILLSSEYVAFGIGYVQSTNSEWEDYLTVNFVTTATEPVAVAARTSVEDTTIKSATEQEVVRVSARATDQNLSSTPTDCPAVSNRRYSVITMLGVDTEHPDNEHGDLNLALRKYIAINEPAQLIQLTGGSDSDAPKLSGIFGDARMPEFVRTYQTHGWDWTCSVHGCRGEVLSEPVVSLIGMRVTAGEELFAPSRDTEIFGGSYIAAILYADTNRLTLAYSREGNIASGYAIHIENICVDPNLLVAYRTTNAGGRGTLPAVKNGEPLGTANGNEIIVAIRDRGAFLDPRSRKDWW